MKTLKETRKAMMDLAYEHTEGDTEKALKLLSVLLMDYMLEAETTEFDIQLGGVFLDVSLTLKHGV